MVKSWIRLFNISERDHLEENLNRMILDNDVSEIKVWNDQGCWNALVRYSYPVSPIYHKPPENEE